MSVLPGIGFTIIGGNVISDEYAAGFFDGEGSVYAATRGTGKRINQSPCLLVCIGNTNRFVLELHQERWGGSICERRNKKHLERVASGKWQRQYQWVLAARMAKSFLLAIEPHVVIKRDVVSAGIKYVILMERPRSERVDYSHRVERRGRHIVSPVIRHEFREEVMVVHREIRRLNALTAPGNVLRQDIV